MPQGEIPVGAITILKKKENSNTRKLHRFEIFSSPGTIAHDYVRLPPRNNFV